MTEEDPTKEEALFGTIFFPFGEEVIPYMIVAKGNLKVQFRIEAVESGAELDRSMRLMRLM